MWGAFTRSKSFINAIAKAAQRTHQYDNDHDQTNTSNPFDNWRRLATPARESRNDEDEESNGVNGFFGVGLTALLPMAVSTDDINRARDEVQTKVAGTKEETEIIDSIFRVVEDPSIQRAFTGSNDFQDLLRTLNNRRIRGASADMYSIEDRPDESEHLEEEEHAVVLHHPAEDLSVPEEKVLCDNCASPIGTETSKRGVPSVNGCAGSAPVNLHESREAMLRKQLMIVVCVVMAGLIINKSSAWGLKLINDCFRKFFQG
eukprot:TRINITY_DN1872_c0_g2_i1.p1 TRINITY_DN1872_c0_g2~~TRINITY_DN1872_c0_g2_i1.p1  ORF type:complete len:260 (-),score=41.08 TRINITY_DN1872_c0_g2_i1:24-803(-)